jgi:surface antigen
VLACGNRQESRRSLYSRTGTARLRWPLLRRADAALVLIAFAAAGCSYPIDTMFSKNDLDAEPTGSIVARASVGDGANTKESAVKVWPEADLAYARAAATDAIARGAKDSSIPWENPSTGAGGNITPLANARTDGSSTCRDFLASYVHGEQQAWLEGEACRTAHGKWEVKSLKPFRQG